MLKTNRMKRYSITMPDYLHKKIKDRAEELGTSVSEFIRHAVIVYLEMKTANAEVKNNICENS